MQSCPALKTAERVLALLLAPVPRRHLRHCGSPAAAVRQASSVPCTSVWARCGRRIITAFHMVDVTKCNHTCASLSIRKTPRRNSVCQSEPDARQCSGCSWCSQGVSRCSCAQGSRNRRLTVCTVYCSLQPQELWLSTCRIGSSLPSSTCSCATRAAPEPAAHTIMASSRMRQAWLSCRGKLCRLIERVWRPKAKAIVCCRFAAAAAAGACRRDMRSKTALCAHPSAACRPADPVEPVQRSRALPLRGTHV